jgi:hypothetical protein
MGGNGIGGLGHSDSSYNEGFATGIIGDRPHTAFGDRYDAGIGERGLGGGYDSAFDRDRLGSGLDHGQLGSSYGGGQLGSAFDRGNLSYDDRIGSSFDRGFDRGIGGEGLLSSSAPRGGFADAYNRLGAEGHLGGGFDGVGRSSYNSGLGYAYDRGFDQASLAGMGGPGSAYGQSYGSHLGAGLDGFYSPAMSSGYGRDSNYNSYGDLLAYQGALAHNTDLSEAERLSRWNARSQFEALDGARGPSFYGVTLRRGRRTSSPQSLAGHEL